MTLGEKIAEKRRVRGMTQEEVAEKLGVTSQAVSKWENNNSLPDITLLPAIARLFDIAVDALLSVEQIDKKARYAEYCARCEPFAPESSTSVCGNGSGRITNCRGISR